MTSPDNADQPGLVVIWVTRDREAALNMALMYAKNSRLKGWWETVHLVVWGPSARLLTEDAELQAEIEDCKAAGVELLACKACADRYGASEALAAMGLEVVYMGEPLTRYLKHGWKVLTI
jgi:hypothetical protein